jgi:hypothetical protein
MGKQQHQAASVSWSEMEEAIKANPQRGVRVQGGAASSSITSLPADRPMAWFPGWTEDPTTNVADGVALSLWIQDPLYRIASGSIRRSMEMEEAASLLQASEAAWKSHNGKIRGWVRKHLEEDLRLRAGGGDAAPDAWTSVKTNKRAALLLDYICVMRGIRVALWYPDQKAVTVVPLSGSQAKSVAQLNCLSCRILFSAQATFSVASESWPALQMAAKAAGEIAWIPPASAPSIGSQTVGQIFERILAMPGGSSAVKTGGRAALWSYYLWLKLKASLSGLDVAELEEPEKPEKPEIAAE